ncbi:hypothetical protein [Subtercola sp. YIM 133946]|uniref:hypothetical protein n=1 Tax=Subtercola sp. YIM 133946 TaxID=3118909 RepID=UPI002F93874B
MTDIPGILASEFADDARTVPGQEAFTNRAHAAEENAIADEGGDSIGDRPIFYKEDAADFTDTEAEAREAAAASGESGSPDEATSGSADL